MFEEFLELLVESLFEVDWVKLFELSLAQIQSRTPQLTTCRLVHAFGSIYLESIRMRTHERQSDDNFEPMKIAEKTCPKFKQFPVQKVGRHALCL